MSRSLAVMAPLLVGSSRTPSEADWQAFEQRLEKVKALGAQAVSTDVWWGMVEPKDNAFDFSYYDRVAQAVEKAGLRWVPILSFHQCGGNVGDTVEVKLPDWLGEKYKSVSSS